ncbi:hypothetical protein [Brevundimonas naejangsanensis]|uniref:hypothetical protein n=1 Tax=Brevundimonas naejangsanensis TaxID=588932 RepID=UPI00320A9038
MIDASRRRFLGTSALLSVGGAVGLSASSATASTRLQAPTSAGFDAKVEHDLRRYVDFGIKQAGGEGDNACGEWMAAELTAAGYAVERQYYDVPYFEARAAELTMGEARAAVYPQPIVIPTGPQGVSGPLVRVDARGAYAGSLEGAIALVDLPFGRWSTMIIPAARRPVEAAFAAGARAVVAITNGPTGKVIALNADGRKPMFSGPVALLAPEDAGAFLTGAVTRQEARLTLDGAGGHRPAFNFVGRVDRGKGRWLAVSTPRSGWFTCAAERGGGVAAWLALARWAAKGLPDHDLAFVCNTGHEYEYLGASEAMKKIAPLPADTRFWLHLGANFAARDWHELPGYLEPLPSVDSQRYLSISPEFLPLARSLFAGQPGHEAPVSSAVMTAGELDEVVRAGYAPAAGTFGIHRYHHVAEDDARCIDVAATRTGAEGFRRLIEAVLATQA